MFVTVKSAAMRKALDMVKALKATIFSVRVLDGTLYLTAESGVAYQYAVKVDVYDVPAITVTWVDANELIPNRGDCELEFGPNYLVVQCANARITYTAAYNSLMLRKHEKIYSMELPKPGFSVLYAILSPAKSLFNLLKRERPLTIKDGKIFLSFPQVVLCADCDFPSTQLSMDELEILSKFSPEDYAIIDGLFVFYSGDSRLYFPKHVTKEQAPKFSTKPLCRLNMEGLLTKFEKLSKVAKGSLLKVFIADNTMFYTLQAPEFSISSLPNSKVVKSFEIPYEMLIMLLRLYDNYADIEEMNNAICLKTDYLTTVISVLC